MPIMDPELTIRQVRKQAERALPGAAVRLLVLWRHQLRTQIADPELRAKCVPDYTMGCKRVVFSDDWYPALARPDVELVTDPIERIVPDGVVTADGTARARSLGTRPVTNRSPSPSTKPVSPVKYQPWRSALASASGRRQ